MTETLFHIERLGHQGDGIAQGPVFAPRCLPGEIVTGDVADGRIASPRIVTPSADRIKAPCAHYNACGGCSLQHASDDFVANWKNEVVGLALSARGISADLAETETSPALSRRRATLSARRGKKGPIVGFHGRASGSISGIDNCKLLVPEILDGCKAVGALAMAGASRKAEISATLTLSANGLDVAVTGGKPLDRTLEATLAQLLHEYGLARLSWDGEVIAMARAPFQVFGAAKVTPPPGAFLQATKEGEASLLAVVKEGLRDARRVVDLFAGCGTFSLPLAENAEVHAVEGQADMMQALDAGWRHTSGLRMVTTETRDLFRAPLLPDEFKGFDAAVIDPPRAGAEAQIAELAKSGIKRIAMVSCNPVTFARDASVLVGAGYEMGPVHVVDQFRWSTHVEQAAIFRLP
ncbi:class I SAM-dependent RNA methyltransferase [Aliiroseovarius marinus]|uniref:class I SAM-dependent RNA methyltransferase n=1 Tax=Aliiroseovarius marinus TaxID=2500159 RepID=UPI003D7E3F78